MALLRQRDKYKLFAAKKNLKNTRIYIDDELTKHEASNQKKLRDTAKIWKATNKGLKTTVRNGRLKTLENGVTKIFAVNADGIVEEIRRR